MVEPRHLISQPGGFTVGDAVAEPGFEVVEKFDPVQLLIRWAIS
jgi:hypothetical protein